MDENKAATYMVSLVGNQTSQGLAKTPFNVDYGNGIASADAATKTGFYYINIGDSSRPSFKQVDGAVQGDYRVLTTAHSDNWLQQIATDFRSNDVFVRRKQNGSWIDWTPIVKMQQGADACPIPDASNNAINYLPRFDQTRNATIVPSNLKIKTGSSADEIYGATVSDSSDNSTLITKGYAMSKYIAVLNSTPNAVARYADNAGQLADSTVLINDAGNVSATSYTVNEDCTLEYSDTTGCLTFVFAS